MAYESFNSTQAQRFERRAGGSIFVHGSEQPDDYVVDFMKIDVEGAEERVLAGGASLFQGVGAPPVMFEANDDLAANLNSSTCAAKQMLSDFGYQIYRVLPNRLNPVEIHERHWGEDLIALKPEHFLRHSELFQAFSR